MKILYRTEKRRKKILMGLEYFYEFTKTLSFQFRLLVQRKKKFKMCMDEQIVKRILNFAFPIENELHRREAIEQMMQSRIK